MLILINNKVSGSISRKELREDGQYYLVTCTMPRIEQRQRETPKINQNFREKEVDEVSP